MGFEIIEESPAFPSPAICVGVCVHTGVNAHTDLPLPPVLLMPKLFFLLLSPVILVHRKSPGLFLQVQMEPRLQNNQRCKSLAREALGAGQ